MWLMQALGFLLSALPVEEILVRLHSLITPHVQQLDTLAQQEVDHDKLMQRPHETPQILETLLFALATTVTFDLFITRLHFKPISLSPFTA